MLVSLIRVAGGRLQPEVSVKVASLSEGPQGRRASPPGQRGAQPGQLRKGGKKSSYSVPAGAELSPYEADLLTSFESTVDVYGASSSMGSLSEGALPAAAAAPFRALWSAAEPAGA